MNNEITLDEFNDPNNLVVADINNLVRDNEYYIKQTFNKGTRNEFINIKKIIFKGFKGYEKNKISYEEPGYPQYGIKNLIKQSIDEVKEETPSNPVLKGGNRNRSRRKCSKRRCSKRRCSKRKSMRRRKRTENILYIT